MNHFKIILHNECKKGLIKYLQSKYMRFQVQTLQSTAHFSGVSTYFHQAVWKISVTKCTRWVVLLSWHESIILATISWTGCLGMLQIRKETSKQMIYFKMWNKTVTTHERRREMLLECRMSKAQMHAAITTTFHSLQRHMSKFTMYPASLINRCSQWLNSLQF